MIRWVRIDGNTGTRIGFIEGDDTGGTLVITRDGISSRRQQITLVHDAHRSFGWMVSDNMLTQALLAGDPHAEEFIVEALWADMEKRDAAPPITRDADPTPW